VSAIFGTHPHQLQGVECYKNSLIFYSLGNFSFHRRGGGLAYCMPSGEYTHKEVYTLKVDPGITYDYRRHWDQTGIAYVELDRVGLKRATFLPAMLNAKGSPEVVDAADPQFETIRSYLEWAAEDIPGGLTRLAVEGDRFVLFNRA
jgi:poly-gamma-glutamate synthesis protein (capsule biosynthesis protein)